MRHIRRLNAATFRQMNFKFSLDSEKFELRPIRRKYHFDTKELVCRLDTCSSAASDAALSFFHRSEVRGRRRGH